MGKICLNMIIKNESKIITRLLESVVHIIDTYCICDTGSDDNTVEIINNYFKNTDISGKIIYMPFINFEHNRNHSLNECVNMENADYLLLLDADMVLDINKNLNIDNFKNYLNYYDVHYIFQGTENFYYKNIRLIKNDGSFKYCGVTHEYLQLKKTHTYGHFKNTDIFIKDIGDGGSKKDKFTRDIHLLNEALEIDSNNSRYLFYLANSYYNINDYSNAISNYKKCINLCGWEQEIWYSYYSLGNCYEKLKDHANAIFYWIKAVSANALRIENLYKIVEYYRCNNEYELAYDFFIMADQKRKRIQDWDMLFLEKDIYIYKLDYELSIIGYYIKHNQYDMPSCCMNLFTQNIPDWMYLNIIKNYKFYAPVLDGSEFKIELPKMYKDKFSYSTPSICKHNNKIFINIRFVNYTIDYEGKYITEGNIENINVLCVYDNEFNKMSEYVLKHNKALDNKYVGIEDIRLLSNNYLYFNANRGFENRFKIEHGTIINDNIKSTLLSKDNEASIEKNWVLFANGNREIKCIYNWHPLTVGKINNNRFVTTDIIETPDFFKNIRGSTNGVFVNNEIWFICHVVSHEERRHYYHCFISIDRNTYKIKNYSYLFTFEKSIVEYTLGFINHLNTLIVGYSVMDAYTKFKQIDICDVEKMFLFNR